MPDIDTLIKPQRRGAGFRLVTLFLVMCGCESSLVADLNPNEFACVTESDCSPDAGAVTMAMDAFVDATLDASDIWVDASDASMDAVVDTGPILMDMGFLDAEILDSGPDAGRDAGIGTPVNTSTTCSWLARTSTSGQQCDEPKVVLPGDRHSCAIRESGQVVCWGHNANGQLGDGTNLNRNVPVTVLGLSQTTTITLGLEHTCALDHGNVWCWGKNNYGQLGVSQTAYPNVSYPVQVLDSSGLPLIGVSQIEAGDNHTCALVPTSTTGAGDLFCWGNNRYRQCGQNVPSTSPAQLSVASATQVITPREYLSVHAGGDTSCATAMENGLRVAYCWGRNDRGQAGSGRLTKYESVTSTRSIQAPVEVENSKRGVVQIALGDRHACLRATDNRISCWGDSSLGQVSFITTVPTLSPTRVITYSVSIGIGGTVFVAFGRGRIFAGRNHTCAVVASSFTTEDPAPGSLFDTRKLYCWGDNSHGQLGQQQYLGAQKYKTGLSAIDNNSKVWSGGNSSCALTADKKPYCWGDNQDLELADGSYHYSFVPLDVPGLSGISQLATGDDFTCVSGSSTISAMGETKCFGRNERGQLGRGTLTDSHEPERVILEEGTIAAGDAHACLLRDQSSPQSILCWGDNSNGQLSNELLMTSTSSVPTLMRYYNTSNTNPGNIPLDVGSRTPFTTFQLAVSGNLSCAYQNNGQSGMFVCAGDSPNLINGFNSPPNERNGVAVRKSCEPYETLYAGSDFICGDRGLGLECWGSNREGQLGTSINLGAQVTEPFGHPGLSASTGVGRPDELSLGRAFGCATVSSNTYCWGRNDHGQLGSSVVTATVVPSLQMVETFGQMPLTGVTQLSAGRDHACAKTSLGELYCWGRNDEGQLGNLGTNSHPWSTPVYGAQVSTVVSAGSRHSCSITQSQTLQCWGSNEFGQLGRPNRTRVDYPRPIIQPQ